MEGREGRVIPSQSFLANLHLTGWTNRPIRIDISMGTSHCIADPESTAVSLSNKTLLCCEEAWSHTRFCEPVSLIYVSAVLKIRQIDAGFVSGRTVDSAA